MDAYTIPINISNRRRLCKLKTVYNTPRIANSKKKIKSQGGIGGCGSGVGVGGGTAVGLGVGMLGITLIFFDSFPCFLMESAPSK